jgi:hypothetical protein
LAIASLQKRKITTIPKILPGKGLGMIRDRYIMLLQHLPASSNGGGEELCPFRWAPNRTEGASGATGYLLKGTIKGAGFVLGKEKLALG